MRIHQIEFSGYKPFGAEQRCAPQVLKIAPLTLVFGKNNVGKSSVVRLPRLIAGALRGDDRRLIPLVVDGHRFAESFQDMLHARDLLSVQRFHVVASTPSGEALDVDAQLMLAAGQTDATYLKWHSSNHQTGSPSSTTFKGLLPADAEWEPWRAGAKALLAEMIHLGPVRAPLKGAYIKTDPEKLDERGASAPDWLRDDPELEAAVGDWFSKHLEGWRLQVDRQGSNFSLQMTKSGRRTNAASSGQGIHQVLPIVTHQLLRAQQPPGEFLDIVEQPELHLHAAAQAPLAELFAATAMIEGAHTIVETHSEPLLLRVQRLIAEKRLPADKVRIYFVDEGPEDASVLKEITVHDNGDLDWWPQGVFREDFDEVAAIHRAQRKHNSVAV